MDHPPRPVTHRAWKALGAAFAATLVCAPPRPTGACNCAPDHSEQLELEIVSVTQGGAPVADLAPWRDWSIRVSASASGAAVFCRQVSGGQASSWRHYAPAR